MKPSVDFRPGTTLEVLRHRACLLAAVRQFFDQRGYVEVDTPLLSRERAVDRHIEPFAAVPADSAQQGGGEGDESAERAYLQTSPEFLMKRLLAAGATAIYQLGHVFRRGESGRLHSPEFTMLEWYRTGQTHWEQMETVEELVIEVFDAASRLAVQGDGVQGGQAPEDARRRAPNAAGCLVRAPFLRTTYRDAFVRHAGADATALDAAGLAEIARRHSVPAPEGLSDRDDWLNLLLAELVEPNLGIERPEFVYDYPASQSALARIRRGPVPVAERFELYIRGIEICNGYHELTDAGELERRIEAESARRLAAGLPALPVPVRLLAAMESGLPACAGVALGFDRMAMLALGAQTVAEVVPFAGELS